MFEVFDKVVTFLLTDIEGSTGLWEQSPQAMAAALARHDEIVRHALETHGGNIFKTAGDAFYSIFEDASSALAATIAAQCSLQKENWQNYGLKTETSLRVRMALHTGEVQQRDSDYFGPNFNRAARILSAGHGGQILLSAASQRLVHSNLPPNTKLRDMGFRRLKDLARPEQIFQVVADGLVAEFPPLKTLDNHPTNLPAPPTSFVGREQEVTTVRDLLRQPEVRLLTLTGPGGTGKTRLSIETAGGLLDEFEHGIFFVALAALSDETLMFSAIAQALSVRESPGTSIAESLKTFLRDRKLMLILDNFEQLMEAAPLVTELLAVAPGLKVLVSSREALFVYGEQEFEVPPLSLPDLENLPDLATLAQNEAVSLFVQRAKSVKFNFGLTAENAATIAQLCTRLDGLPLAIELAAVRSRQFTPAIMLEQLEGALGARLDLLSQGPRDLPARQRTLRGAIDWSYQLLDETEKRLFERLGVFNGGWSATAAYAMCQDIFTTEIKPNEPAANLSTPGQIWIALWTSLNSLADKSLIHQPENETELTDPNNQTDNQAYQNFSMLETICEYATERLAQRGELAEIQRKHAVYYTELAETAEPELRGPQQVEWIKRLEAEHNNMRAALRWLLNQHELTDLEMALRLAASLRWFWQMHNYLSEGRAWLETAFNKDVAQVSGAVQAKAFTSAGVLALRQADYAQAKNLLTQSLILLRQLDDKTGLMSTLGNLGNAEMTQNNYEQAKPYYEECLVLQREFGSKHGIALVLGNLGVVGLYEGNYADAEPFFEEALALQRELENKQEIAGMLLNLGCVMLYRGEYERGVQFFRESLEVFRELGHQFGIIQVLEGLAGIAGAQWQSSRAAQLFGAAEALRARIGAPLSPSDQLFYQPITEMTRVLLGSEDYEKFWAAGRAMSQEQAIAFALAEMAGTPAASII